jgi:putative transposase
MARPLRIQYSGAFYHITCRGIERRDIFADDKDRNRFFDLLKISLKTYQVHIHAYTLMRNHFHLLIQTSKANCAEFMRHFNICYTGWFNWRHGRAGNLYQGRYKGFLIDADNYLLEVSRYLHLNIARVKPRGDRSWQDRWSMVKAYRWSSLAGYLYDKKAVSFVNYDLVLEMAGGRRAYGDFMQDGLRRDLDNPFNQARNQLILGDEQFVSRAKERVATGSQREQPAYRDLVLNRIDPERALAIISKALKTSSAILSQPRGAGVVRGIAAELLYRYCDLTQARLGRLLGGIDYMAVYQLRRRLRVRLIQDPLVKKMFVDAETEIKKALL